jgi:hypothetical protein
VNALADEAVGEYVNDHFVSAAQKVGTFRIVNGEKQGGNVAAYFCRPDGTVVHAVPGPVDARTFLSEARFAVELDKLAKLNGEKSGLKQKLTVADAHQKRVTRNRPMKGDPDGELLAFGGWGDPFTAKFGLLEPQAQVSVVLMQSPLPKLDKLYPFVWEKILKEQLNVLPVAVK